MASFLIDDTPFPADATAMTKLGEES
jgi:hypothetical protein